MTALTRDEQIANAFAQLGELKSLFQKVCAQRDKLAAENESMKLIKAALTQ